MPTTTRVLDTRVHPTPRAAAHTGPIPLVCVPAVSMPNAAGLVFYDKEGAAALDDLAALQRSLGRVLEAYPQLAGRLRLTQPGDVGRPYTTRYKRTWMEYGRDDDPGVRFTVVDDSRSLAEVLPAPIAGHTGIFQLETVYDLALGPELAKPIDAPGRGDGGDGATAGVKITRFADGAALCFASSHAFFDAGALGTFLHDWTAVHGELAEGKEPILPVRPFDTESLDALAAGDLDAESADPSLVEAEAALDVFRYDSWARDPTGKDNPPPGLDDALAPPPEVDALDAAQGRPRGTPPPWHTASADKPLTYGLEFSSEDVVRIHAATMAARGNDDGFISPQDAFAAHLVRLIARARQHSPDTQLDVEVACDDRRRFDPPLPETAPGCFNVCLGFNLTAGDVLAPTGRLTAANRIRSAITGVTAPRLAAWLHRRAHDLDPTREWIVFAGNTTVCSTNWARSALYHADFGRGRPCYVHNLVHGFGGYLVIGRQAVPRGKFEGKWYEPGVFVALWLEEAAMVRLVADPELRGW